MIGNFEVELDGVKFNFRTMNTQRLQLFQVYVEHETKQKRFHIQRKGEAEFYITDIDHCPEPYRRLEARLSSAIFDYGKTIDPHPNLQK